MTLAGIAMTRVGDRPRQRDVGPSFRAIFRKPSSVEVKVFRLVSSTAQSVAGVTDVEVREGLRVARVAEEDSLGAAAMQKGEVLFTQKTSRQQAVTPRFFGRLVKDEGGREEDKG